MKKVLALTCERFCLAAEGESSTSSDEDLIEALENCWTRSPSSRRLTELETLRRLCGACYFRLKSGKPIEVPDDLAYLDALQDTVSYEWPWEWKITKDLEFIFT